MKQKKESSQDLNEKIVMINFFASIFVGNFVYWTYPGEIPSSEFLLYPIIGKNSLISLYNIFIFVVVSLLVVFFSYTSKASNSFLERTLLSLGVGVFGGYIGYMSIEAIIEICETFFGL